MVKVIPQVVYHLKHVSNYVLTNTSKVNKLKYRGVKAVAVEIQPITTPNPMITTPHFQLPVPLHRGRRHPGHGVSSVQDQGVSPPADAAGAHHHHQDYI